MDVQRSDGRSGNDADASDTRTLSAPGVPPAVQEIVPGEPLAPLGARFEHVRLLGRGGMGVVYLCRDRQLDRLVAVKRIALPAGAANSRIEREARLTARIEHPNVVTVYDVRVVDDAVYILSEYIEGTSLDRIDTPVAWTQVLVWGLHLARGLAAAHAHGILHRDIKPGNAILDERTQQAKLIDFGVATIEDRRRDAHAEDPARAITRPNMAARGADSDRAGDIGRPAPLADTGSLGTPPGARPGTPRYQAPEIWDGQPASTRSDVYALGVLLYELCTGREPPVVADPATRRATRVAQDEVDARFAHIVNRCIELDPDQRYASGTELAEALARLHAAPIAPENPYRGLLCFHERHRGLFFGRELDTARIVERLRAAPFLLLVGDSGVGKSSLGHAGVLGRLRQDGLDARRAWSVEAMVPGRRPLAALAHALGEDEPARSEGSEDHESSERALVRAVRARHEAEGTGLVLFVDQLEELLTVSEPGEARRAQALLAHLIEQRLDSVRVLAAVRGDQLTALAELPALGGLLQEHIYLVRTLDPAGIRAAIVQPAHKTGVTFESEVLVDHLLQATLRARGGMPLLQFALAELWAARDVARGVITRQSLDEIGGVEGALARYADGVLAELPRREQRDAARQILLELVALHHRTRVRCTRRDLVGTDAIGQGVLDRLVDRRLVVCHQVEGEWVYAIAHEALLAAWPTLRGWLDRESALLMLKGRLADAAQQWLALGRSDEAVWGRRLLREAEQLDPDELPPDQAAFLAASRRALRRKRWLLGGSVMAVLVLVAGIYADSRAQARRALAAKVEANLVEARRWLKDASALHQQYTGLHEHVQDRLQAGANDWNEAWQDALARDPRVLEAYRKAGLAAEAAHALDPGREDVTRLLARVLEGHAWFTDTTGRREDRDELIERLARLDSARAAPWHEPVRVRIETVPAGASIEILQYVWQAGAAFGRETIVPLAQAPLEHALAPGSYLVLVHASGDRAEVRYPLQIQARKDRRRETISIQRPRAADVPAGFVYVPEGWFWSGYGQIPEQEGYRTFHEAPPLHRKHTDAYLIRKHETTYREWLAYVDTCTTRACPGGAPARAIRVQSDDMTLTVKHVPGRGWQMHWRPDASRDGYRAKAGEHLAYETRAVLSLQDWLDFPVSGISWIEAQGYLAHLREVKGVRGADLCTEAQWEHAARGADDRMFPHGNGLLASDANIDTSYGQVQGAFGPDHVGAHPWSASPYGGHDMAGNVAEMTRPARSGAAKSATPVDLSLPTFVRGGAFYYNGTNSRVFNRWVMMPRQSVPQVGFRVCAAAPVE